MPVPGRLTAPDWTVQRVRASWSSVMLALIAIVAVVVATGVFVAASQPLGWIVAAASVALVLSPVVEIQARWMPRVVAILTTLVIGVSLVASVGVAMVLSTQDQLGQLSEDLPAAAAELEAGQGPDGMFRQIELESLVQDLVDQASRRVSPRPTVDDATGTAPAFFVSGVLVIFFLVWGRRMFDGAVRQISDSERREWFTRWVLSAAVLTERYIAGALVTALAVGTAGGGLAWWANLPTPMVLGVVLGAASVLPYVGVVFGGVPMLLLSAGSEPMTTTVLVAVGIVIVQVAASVFTRLVVEAHSLRVGPAVIVIAALIGSDVYGIGGALVSIVGGILAMALIERASESAQT